MKVKINDSKTTPKEFVPVNITISIENANDLNLLWHLFNMSFDSLKSFSVKHDTKNQGCIAEKLMLPAEEEFQVWFYLEKIRREKLDKGEIE